MNSLLERHLVSSKVLRKLFNRMDVDGNCWIWTGYMNGPTPTVEVLGKRLSVKNVVYINTYKEEFYDWAENVKIIQCVNVCENELCCNPEHLIVKGTEKYFWANVDISPDENDCWEWKLKPNAGGYGDYARSGSAKNEGAHRLAHMYYYKTDNSAPVIMHTCDNRICVNPHHLVVGDDLANMRDKIDKGRHSKINPDDVTKIKAMILSGEYTRDRIGEIWGVSEGLINDIARLKSWDRDKYDKLPDGRSFRVEMRKRYDLKEGEKGILYVIENTITGWLYVGFTTDRIMNRLKDHKSRLLNGIHPSDDMNDHCKAYGWDSFDIMEMTQISNCNWKDAEIALIHQYRDEGYNLYNTEHI